MHGYHGVYPEEKILGTTYVISVKVGLVSIPVPSDIANTINYERLLACVKQSMKKSVDLLEELVDTIHRKIKKEFRAVETLYISVKKLHPPLGAKVACAEVILSI